MTKTVDILLATYNGARYLTEQIESLRSQTHQDWRLWIQDDGSSDETPSVIDAYASMDARIRVLRHVHHKTLGASGNFICLFGEVALNADYLMFCDQDDIWLPEKIEATLKAMQVAEAATPGPVLVHCDLEVVDERLRLLANSFWQYGDLNPDRCALHHVVIHNNVTGCALMINKELRDLIVWPKSGIIMHDWWLTLAASAFGRITALSEPLILYRQHSSNSLGAQSVRMTGLLRNFRHPRETQQLVRERLLATQRQAAAFLDCYADRLSQEQRYLLNHYSHLSTYSFWKRRQWLFKLRTFKASALKNLGLLLAV